MTTVTPLELAIMRALWRRGEATVKEVRADLAPTRKLAYTTVMTVMDRLFRKGLARRRRRSRAHVYEPAVGEARLRSDAVSSLVGTWFGGSGEALSTYLDTGDTVEPEGESETANSPPPARSPAPEPRQRTPIDESLL